MAAIFFQLSSNPWVRATCWTLLHSLWQGLLLALLAGLILLATRHSSAAFRYRWLMAVFCCGLVWSAVTFCRELQHPGWRLGLPAEHVVATAGSQPVFAPTRENAAQRNWTDYFHAGSDLFNRQSILVFSAWLLVFLAKSVNLAGNLGYLRRIRKYRTSPVPADWQQKIQELADRIGLQRPVLFLQSALVRVPMVLGYLKPVILVPVGALTRLSPEQVEVVLLHELAHIRRRDYLFNLLQSVAESVFFFNPGLLWLSSLIREERENCCDDLALAYSGGNRELAQALLLFQEEEGPAPKLATAFPGRGNHLLRRVRRMLYQKNQTLNTMEKIFLSGSLFAIVVAGVAFSGISHPAPAPRSTDKVFQASNAKSKNPAIADMPVAKPAASRNALETPAVIDTVPASSSETVKPALPKHKMIYVIDNYRIETVNNEITQAWENDVLLSPDALKAKLPELQHLVELQRKEMLDQMEAQGRLLELQKAKLEAQAAELAETAKAISGQRMKVEIDKDFKEKSAYWAQEEAARTLEYQKQRMEYQAQVDQLLKAKVDAETAAKLQYELELNKANLAELNTQSKLQLDALQLDLHSMKFRFADIVYPVLDNLQQDGLIAGRDPVSFELTWEHLIVNKKVQSKTVAKTYRDRFLKNTKEYIIYSSDGKGATHTDINLKH